MPIKYIIIVAVSVLGFLLFGLILFFLQPDWYSVVPADADGAILVRFPSSALVRQHQESFFSLFQIEEPIRSDVRKMMGMGIPFLFYFRGDHVVFAVEEKHQRQTQLIEYLLNKDFQTLNRFIIISPGGGAQDFTYPHHLPRSLFYPPVEGDIFHPDAPRFQMLQPWFRDPFHWSIETHANFIKISSKIGAQRSSSGRSRMNLGSSTVFQMQTQTMSDLLTMFLSEQPPFFMKSLTRLNILLQNQYALDPKQILANHRELFSLPGRAYLLNPESFLLEFDASKRDLAGDALEKLVRDLMAPYFTEKVLKQLPDGSLTKILQGSPEKVTLEKGAFMLSRKDGVAEVHFQKSSHDKAPFSIVFAEFEDRWYVASDESLLQTFLQSENVGSRHPCFDHSSAAMLRAGVFENVDALKPFSDVSVSYETGRRGDFTGCFFFESPR